MAKFPKFKLLSQRGLLILEKYSKFKSKNLKVLLHLAKLKKINIKSPKGSPLLVKFYRKKIKLKWKIKIRISG